MLKFTPVDWKELVHLRERYLKEVDCQIIHNSHHERGFTQLYRVGEGGTEKGYGAVGDYDHRKKEIIKEIYLHPEFRADSLRIFKEFIKATRATSVQAQTNDVQLTLLMYDTCEDIKPDLYLFADSGIPTKLKPAGAIFRKLTEVEKGTAFDHKAEPIGEYGIESDGKIVATGGWLTHYNPPYADLYMEVEEQHRERGFGSYLIQQLRQECRSAGYLPAARTGHDNIASRRTLQRGGMDLCARTLAGSIRG